MCTLRPSPAAAAPRWACSGRSEAARRALDAAPTPAALAEATRRASGPRACGALMQATSEALLAQNPQSAALIATLAMRRWPGHPSLGPLAIEATLRAGQVAQARALLTELQAADPRAQHTRAAALWVALAEGDLSAALRQADTLPAEHPAAVCAYARAEQAADPRSSLGERCAGAPLGGAPPPTRAAPRAGPPAQRRLHGSPAAPSPRPGAAPSPRAPAAPGPDWRGAVAEAHSLARQGERGAAATIILDVLHAFPDDPGLRLLAIRWGPAAAAPAALEALLIGPPPPPGRRPTCPSDAALGAVMGRAAVDLAQLRLKAGDEVGARLALAEAKRRFGPSPAVANLERRLRAASPGP